MCVGHFGHWDLRCWHPLSRSFGVPASDVIERRLGKVSYTTDGIVCGYRKFCCMVHWNILVHSLTEASPCPLFSRESSLSYYEHCVKDLNCENKEFSIQFNSNIGGTKGCAEDAHPVGSKFFSFGGWSAGVGKQNSTNIFSIAKPCQGKFYYDYQWQLNED